MPRKRMTRSGDDAQNIGSVPGQRYGEGVEQQAMQQAMPAPDKTGAPLAASTVGAPGPATEVNAPTAPPGMDPAQVMQFLAQNNPALLARTQSPDQPVTAGLPMGPGTGPQSLSILQSSTPLARMLTTLTDQTGDPTFRRLAERAGL